LRPAADWPDTANVAVDLARVRAVIDRIATDVDELARARWVEELDITATLRRLASRTVSARRDQPPVGRLHRQPIPPPLTTLSWVCSANWTP
jgi:hypothetical protein